jgi:hypothetical protein
MLPLKLLVAVVALLLACREARRARRLWAIRSANGVPGRILRHASFAWLLGVLALAAAPGPVTAGSVATLYMLGVGHAFYVAGLLIRVRERRDHPLP